MRYHQDKIKKPNKNRQKKKKKQRERSKREKKPRRIETISYGNNLKKTIEKGIIDRSSPCRFTFLLVGNHILMPGSHGFFSFLVLPKETQEHGREERMQASRPRLPSPSSTLWFTTTAWNQLWEKKNKDEFLSILPFLSFPSDLFFPFAASLLCFLSARWSHFNRTDGTRVIFRRIGCLPITVEFFWSLNGPICEILRLRRGRGELLLGK